VFKPYLLLPLIALLAWWSPRLGSSFFRAIERGLDRLALRPGRAVLLVGVLSLAICLILGRTIAIIPPQTHDEFGYLLIADTFSHGRVTNPAHPHWQHFETVHVLQQPTYASKYPPAQGLAMAVGETTTGLPIVGVWLSVALASATVCWMLLAWMPPRWALVGGLLTALHPQMIVWSQNYWGGTIALAGGAIVLGAFRRLLRGPTIHHSLWLGLGMAILANSRPYEGFIFSALICTTLLVWMIARGGPDWPVSLGKIGLPLVGTMLLLAAQIGYYNYRVTGSAWRMPYFLCEETYGITPLFLFQKPRPEPGYRHAELRALHQDYLRFFQKQRASAGALAKATWKKIHTVLESCLWFGLLLVPLLGAPWAIRRDHWLRLTIPGGIIFSAAMLLGTWVYPHYAAPAAGVFIVLVVASMRRLKAWTVGGRRCGLFLVRGTMSVALLSLALPIARLAQPDRNRWDYQRNRILKHVANQPGRHLVFIHYRPGHNPHREWVYNDAVIDSSKVVIARIMSPESNAKLGEHFSDRKWWVIEADARPPTLAPIASTDELPPPVPVAPPQP